MQDKPLAIDLFCGLGGWTDGLLAEGYYVIGFDIERHEYGDEKYPGELVLQDVLTLHGSQFKDAALIVASPPCQAYSYRAMPWKRAKALPPPDNSLFDACFRIQREACEAAGRNIPMVVENVRGAQKWVGRAKWHYGSFYLWGDVPALMPITKKHVKVPGLGMGWRPPGHPDHRPGVSFNGQAERLTKWGEGQSPGKVFSERPSGNVAAHREGTKIASERGRRTDIGRGERFTTPHKNESRKRASALIAKIPLRLARWIGRCYYPEQTKQASQ